MALMMNTPALSPVSPRGQHGAVILALLLFLALALLTPLLGALLARSSLTQAAASTQSLAEARAALLAYAAAYRDNHPGEVFGYLPCPNLDGSGNAQPECGARDIPVIGLLPFKTLGLANYRDAEGNCLWYAVSGRFKNNPPSMTLNWDSHGQFRRIGADPARDG